MSNGVNRLGEEKLARSLRSSQRKEGSATRIPPLDHHVRAYALSADLRLNLKLWQSFYVDEELKRASLLNPQ